MLKGSKVKLRSGGRLIINESLGNLVLKYPYSSPFFGSPLLLHARFVMVKVIAE